jgi:predicted XRE-type DNA-binding protein
MTPIDEDRDNREEATRLALADVLRLRIDACKFQKARVARRSGISRSHLNALLRAEKMASLFVFLELTAGLKHHDASELLRAVLRRRDAIREQKCLV